MNKEKSLFFESVRIYSIIFIVIGLVSTVVGIILMINTSYFNANSVPVEAKITSFVQSESISKQYLLSYSLDGQEYNVILKKGQQYNLGDKMNILVNRKLPYNFSLQHKNHLMGIFFLVLGLIFFVSAYMAKKRVENRKKEIDHLLKINNKCKAIVTKIETNTSIRIRGKSPQLVYCKLLDDPQEKIFVSDNIFGTPLNTVGSNVDIYFDPQDNINYYIDVEVKENE